MKPQTDSEKLDHLVRLAQEQGGIINELVERIDDMQERQTEMDDRLTTLEAAR